MAQFQGFARQAEYNGMLARTIGHPEGVDGDLAGPSPVRMAGVAGDEPDAALSLARVLGQAKGRPAGCVFLGLVMPSR